MMVDIPGLQFTDSGNFLLIAGTCVIENEKGQFISGASMKFAVEKVLSTGNNNILLTER